jgi:hypothetical protein
VETRRNYATDISLLLEDAMIYDNPHALVICHYKRDKALCPPRRRRAEG